MNDDLQSGAALERLGAKVKELNARGLGDAERGGVKAALERIDRVLGVLLA